MLLTPTQKEIARSLARFRVVCCGRRWGKTTLAIEEIKGKALSKNDCRIAYIAPTYQQARDIAWSELKKQLEPIIISVNESRLELTVYSQDGGKSTIALRGWEAIETLRGQLFDFIVIDEIASMRNFNEQWQEVIRPTLTDRKGEVLFISTPKGFNHFYDLYNKEKSDTDYKSFHFTSYDNPYLLASEVDKAREELTEDAFAQEYMADFRKAVGLAHKPWNRDVHLIKPFNIPESWYRIRGFDYGSDDPTSSVRIAIDPYENAYIERCYKNRMSTIEEHANAIKAQDVGVTVGISFGDPSGAQWFMEYLKYGLPIMSAFRQTGQASQGWVELCVERVNQLLKPREKHTVRLYDRTIENAPQLFVLDTLENQALVKEIELLRWKESANGQTIPVLDENLDPDGHSDLCAALRYAIVSYYKQPPQTRQTVDEPYGLQAVNQARINAGKETKYTPSLDDELI